MKKIVLAALCSCFFFGQFAHAQLIKGFGIRGGVTWANENWDYSNGISGIDTKQISSVSGGAFVELLPLPIISVIGEADFLQKGTSFDITNTTPANPAGLPQKMTYKSRINYLSLSVLAKVKMPGTLLSPYVVAGPRVDFQLKQDVPEVAKTVYDDFKKTITGVTVGVGTELSFILPVALFAELQYQPDLTYAYDKDNLKIKNKALNLSLGVHF